MVKGLENKKKENEDIFKKNRENQKERGRVLDEIFKESTKHVDRSGEKPLRDFDFDQPPGQRPVAMVHVILFLCFRAPKG